VAALPTVLSGPGSIALTRPALAGAVLGGTSLGLLLGWAGVLSLLARVGGAFSLAQSVMLVTWPCWPVFVGLLIALVAATRPPLSLWMLGSILLAGSVGTLLVVTARCLYDYVTVSPLSLLWTPLLIVLSPLGLMSLSLVYLVTQNDISFSFLWHLLTRT